MKENLIEEKLPEKDYIFGIINKNIKVILLMVLNMEKEFINGPMELNMKVIMLMELEKETVYINGMMEEYLKVNLKMVSPMGKENLHIMEKLLIASI